MIRGDRLIPMPDVGYHAYDDLLSFVAETEVLRNWGQNWKHAAANSPHPMPIDAWRVTDGWQLPASRPGWPERGRVPYLSLPENLLTGLVASG